MSHFENEGFLTKVQRLFCRKEFMSKTIPTKYTQQNLQKIPNAPLAQRAVNAPSIRQVQALPAVVSDKNNMLVAYKDLNQDVENQLKQQKQQMFFAFSVFMLLGVLILIGQFMSKPRMVASSEVGFKVQGEPTQVEHYQYDKSCYRGDNGEQVCLTRTSQKR